MTSAAWAGAAIMDSADAPAEVLGEIQWVLDHPEEAADVAQAGRDKVLATHTFQHRVRDLLHVVGL